jgi:alkylhydroperoxidase family enzyme
MTAEQTIPEAWVQIPSNEELRAGTPPAGAPRHPYDFGFWPAMARLVMAHPRIGAAFAQLFAQIMFAPEGALDRREREMVAAVAAAAQDCHY